jgi:3-hydroxybutyryl-CoA dehydratase
MSMLENFTYDELVIGQSATYTREVTEDAVRLFAAVSGDVNPLHLDEAYAATTRFKGRIAHGMFTGGLISAAIAMVLPGPGVVYIGQTMSFERPVRIGDTITVELTVTAKLPEKQFVTMSSIARNQLGKVVVSGETTVLAPGEKLRIERPAEPRVTLEPQAC